MDHRPYASATTKAHRARQLIHEIKSEMAAYRHFYIRPVERSDGDIDWTLRVLSVPPTDLASLVGDAVHNIRSVLDHAAVSAAIIHSGYYVPTSFPFASDEANLHRAIKESRFHKAGPAAVQLVRSLKPYAGGNDDLKHLHQMDILDKHIGLITTHALAIPDASIGTVPPALDGVQVSIIDGFRAATLPRDERYPLEPIWMKGMAQFGPETPYANQSVTRVLTKLADTVEVILDQFKLLSG